MDSQSSSGLSGLTGKIDPTMVVHGLIIVVLVLVVYHFVFHR